MNKEEQEPRFWVTGNYTCSKCGSPALKHDSKKVYCDFCSFQEDKITFFKDSPYY